MKDGEQHIDFVLISKYLSGESSQSEAKIIEDWRDSSKDNAAEFDRLARLWQEAVSLTSTTPASVNTDAAWNLLHGRIFGDEAVSETKQPESDSIHTLHPEDVKKGPEKKDTSTGSGYTESKTRTLYFYTTRIAAVIVIGILIYAVFFTRGGHPDLIEVVTDNVITVTDLPDETKITLNENSRISYPEKFKAKDREVELTGEAFFEVNRNDEKPFVIYAQNAIIRVLGTSFNVRAVESESEVSVTVEQGKVRLSDEEDVAYVVLERNEKGIFNRNTGHIEKYERAEGSELFWRSRTLMFRDTELSAVFRTLERLYEMKIIIKNEKILSCVLTGKFQDMEIEEILEKIAINFNLTILKYNNTFEISGDGC
jgi:ferric-dicitrate binding protein FerR (iron transport regulator)